jgi:hypothetical protein
MSNTIRNLSLILTTVVALSSCSIASAATIGWKGEVWDDNYGNTSLNVNGFDQLEVSATPAPNGWSAAHFNTDVAFRSSATPFVEFGFLDTGNPVRKEIWIEDETTSPLGSAGGWLQFGANGGTYKIFYNDYDADLTDDSIVNFSTGQSVDTGVARSVGERLLKIGRRADGTVDFWIDGMLSTSLSAAQFSPNFFGDIYLGSRYENTAFTHFVTGGDYAIPEPSTIALLGIAGVAGLAVVRRRRQG